MQVVSQVLESGSLGRQELPPDGRDFDIYRMVKIEQRSTRIVAEAAGLSQTRICQLVTRVENFLLANLPAADDDEQRRRQLKLAEQIAAERLEYLQQRSLEAFDKSQRTIEIKGQQFVGRADPRFLYLAGRLAAMGAKLPAARLNAMVFTANAQVDEAEEADEVAAVDTIPAATSPPVEDCSANSPSPPDRPRRGRRPTYAKPLPAESSIAGVSVDLFAKLQQPRPVQFGENSESEAAGSGSKRKRRAAFLRGA